MTKKRTQSAKKAAPKKKTAPRTKAPARKKPQSSGDASFDRAIDRILGKPKAQ